MTDNNTDLNLDNLNSESNEENSNNGLKEFDTDTETLSSEEPEVIFSTEEVVESATEVETEPEVIETTEEIVDTATDVDTEPDLVETTEEVVESATEVETEPDVVETTEEVVESATEVETEPEVIETTEEIVDTATDVDTEPDLVETTEEVVESATEVETEPDVVETTEEVVESATDEEIEPEIVETTEEVVDTDSIAEEPIVTGSRSDSKSKPKEHIVAIIIRGFISFVGAVMLFLLLTMLIVKQTLMTPDFMIKVGSESSYFSTIAKDTSRSIQDLGLGSGIPEGVLTEIVSEDTVKKDFSEYIKDSYTGKTQTLDSAEFVKHVSEVINKYSQENDLPQTDESKASVAEFAEHAYTERYVPSIQLKYWPMFASRLTAYSKTLEYVIVVLLGVTVLMVALLLLTTRKVGYRRYSYLSYMFLSSGLMTLVIPIYILAKKIIERINIDSEALYKFMTTYLNDIVMYFIYAGAITLVIGVIFVVASLTLERKQNKLSET